MPRRVLVFKGSPRENGNSSSLADRAAEGVKAAGANMEVFSLHRMDIRPCDACDTCQETGVCVLKDDMQSLYPKLAQADAIIIASPIYWFTLSAQTKLFIDRWYGLESPNGNALKGKQFGVLLTYGDTDPYSSGAINAIRTFQDMFRYIGANLRGLVYGTALDVGDVQKQPELMERAYKLGEKLGTGN
ncbi:MAG TPA: flavodoxin family protein [Anaerolineales bacterium]|nr:flavodoxin family protein [Anaerolineales bacterium]